MRQIKGNSRASGGTPRAPAEKNSGKFEENWGKNEGNWGKNDKKFRKNEENLSVFGGKKRQFFWAFYNNNDRNTNFMHKTLEKNSFSYLKTAKSSEFMHKTRKKLIKNTEKKPQKVVFLHLIKNKHIYNNSKKKSKPKLYSTSSRDLKKINNAKKIRKSYQKDTKIWSTPTPRLGAGSNCWKLCLRLSSSSATAAWLPHLRFLDQCGWYFEVCVSLWTEWIKFMRFGALLSELW
jgi:hypothetical protein